MLCVTCWLEGRYVVIYSYMLKEINVENEGGEGEGERIKPEARWPLYIYGISEGHEKP